jgi:predicted polyphosphate/ATP-dependent NAD kinase
VAEVGEIALRIPSGSMTTADAVALLSALLDAVMVMFGGDGMTLGAVYRAAAEIVPALAVHRPRRPRTS